MLKLKNLNLLIAASLVLGSIQASSITMAFGKDSLQDDAQTASSSTPAPSDSLNEHEVLAAVEDLGGEAAKALGDAIQEVFAQNGRPSAIIVGHEKQGSFFVGYRKGSGKLILPGQTKETAERIYWNAPSIGLNVGASVNRVVILVYGAHSKSQMLQRFASLQGSLHVIAGAGISYLRSNLDLDDKNAINLAYVTVGVGLDAGVALESLSFTKDSSWF